MRKIDPSELAAIQAHFHALIRRRADEFGVPHPDRLPELAELLDLHQEKKWFPVRGMYGGFSYRLEGEEEAVKLVCESWSRVVGFSEQVHEITSEGSRLIESGGDGPF